MFTLVSTGMLWAQDRLIAGVGENGEIPLHVLEDMHDLSYNRIDASSKELPNYPLGSVRAMAEWGRNSKLSGSAGCHLKMF